MTRRAHVWFLVAIIFLSIATVIGFTTMQTNFNEHEEIDKRACFLSLKNRELLQELTQIFDEDPKVQDPTANRKLEELDTDLKALVVSTKADCLKE